MDLNLAGRVALVTGGSKGIGRSIALTLAREGADVAICARGAEALERTAGEILGISGRRCLAVKSDLSVAEDCFGFVRSAVEHFGRADILVHSANSPSDNPGTFFTLSDEDWVRHMDLKFFAALRCCQEVVPHMQKNKWGRIVLIAGMSGRLVRLNRMDNGPVCAALSNFGTHLAVQLVGDGIRVNTIHPNATETPRRHADMERLSGLRGLSQEEVRKQMLAELPMRRFIQPEEVAGLVAFLCSDLADSITGQTIGIDGGAARSVYF